MKGIAAANTTRITSTYAKCARFGVKGRTPWSILKMLEVMARGINI
jgi:hypothetical protein